MIKTKRKLQKNISITAPTLAKSMAVISNLLQTDTKPCMEHSRKGFSDMEIIQINN